MGWYYNGDEYAIIRIGPHQGVGAPIGGGGDGDGDVGGGSGGDGVGRGDLVLIGDEYKPPPVWRYYYDLNIGWNTRAYVPWPVNGAGVFSFKAGAAVGAIVGLSRVSNATAGYSDIEAGVAVLGGALSVIAGAQVLYESTTYYPTDNIEIRFFQGRVEVWLWRINELEEVEEDFVYTLNTSLDLAYFTAALYVGGDIINDERYWVPDYGVAKIGLKAQGNDYADGYGVATLKLTASGEGPNVAEGIARIKLKAVGAENEASDGLATIGPIVVTGFAAGDDDLEVPFSYGLAVVGPFISFGYGSDVDIGNGGCSLAVKAFGTDYSEYVRGNPKLRIVSAGDELTDFNSGEFVSVTSVESDVYGVTEAFLIFSESMGVIGLLTAQVIETGDINSTVTASSLLSAELIIEAILSSMMSVSDVSSLKQDGMSVWALHMDAMGSTRYDGYDFNSFMTIDGQTYGVNSTGIHRLGGNSDDGALIPASVDFGRLSFGTNNRKALPYVYIGMAASGKTLLKVEADGQTYYYTARDSTEMMKAHRFEPGRGLRASFYGLSIVTDGEAFDLHNIDFQPVELKRSL